MISEEKTIDAVLAGNTLAFEPVIEKYKNSVYAIALRLCKNSEQAESITKESLLHVYENLGSYQESESFSFWFYKEISIKLKELKETPENQDYYKEGMFNKAFYGKMEESVLSLPWQNKFSLLFSYLSIELDDTQIALMLEMNLEEYRTSIQTARDRLQKNILEMPERELRQDCLDIEELVGFHRGDYVRKRADIEDHLEFCPGCREVLDVLKREEKVLKQVLRLPQLNTEFNENVLKQLPPYATKIVKKRTWKYQLGIIGVIVAMIMMGTIVLPIIIPWTQMVGNYVNHGSFYNVWAEGTYTSTDNEITVEITAVDVDPLHILVHYEATSDSKDIDYLGGNDLFSVHALDEEGNSYPLESAQPVLVGEGYPNIVAESKGVRSFYVKALNEGVLPDEFHLNFNFQRIKGWGGDWKIEVPIQYEKVVEDVEIIDLDNVTVIDDKIEVTLLTLEKGKYGSRLKYDVKLKEEEMKRIETNLKKTDQKYDSHFSQSYYDVFAGVVLVNNDEEYLAPIAYPSMNEMMDKRPFQIDFSKLYTDKEYMELKGEATEDGKYSAEIRTVNYTEPGFYSMTIPLEETKEEAMNIDLDGYTLNNLTVKKNEKLPTKVIITGDRTRHDKVRTFDWLFTDEDGQRLDVHNRYRYEGFYNGNNLGLEMINVDVDNEITHMMIHAIAISNDYLFGEKVYRIPLE